MNAGRIVLVAAAIFVLAVPSYGQTPFQIETGHNTAACSNSNRQSYCPISGFPVGDGPWEGGWSDNRHCTDGSPVVTRVVHPGVGDYRSGYAGNISKGRGTPPWPDSAHPGDVHNLLYRGNTTKIFAAVQYWFSTELPITQAILCDPIPDPGQPCTGISQSFSFSAPHKMTGYATNDVGYSSAAAQDLWDRGFDGVIANINTAPFTCPQIRLSSGTYHGQSGIFTESCGPADLWADEALHKLQTAMLTYGADKFQFALQIDKTSFDTAGTCGCHNAPACDYVNPAGVQAGGDLYQPQCIRDQLKAILKYYSQGDKRNLTPFFTAPNYFTPAPKSPMVQFFIFQGSWKSAGAADETTEPEAAGRGAGGDGASLAQCTQSNPCIADAATNTRCFSQKECWQKIWSGLRAYARDDLGLTPYFVFHALSSCQYNARTKSFDNPEADGCFLWTHPNTFNGTLAEQLDWGQTGYVDTFYKNWSAHNGVKGANGRPALFFGGAWKGVSDRFWDPGDVTSGTDRGAYKGLLMSQRSGQTWIDSFAEAGRGFYSVRNQLPYFVVPTYDDYEAGTQFQTGIDNGASVSVSLKGTTLAWATTFADQYGSVKTLHHYRLFDSPDGVSVTVLKDNIPPTLKGSLNISALPVKPGTHKLYVKLVGKAGIFNKISDAGGPDGGLPAFTLTVAKSIAKGGLVSTTDRTISCGPACLTQGALYGASTPVTLRAQPAAGYRFTGWTGACYGTKTTCTTHLIAARTVQANFAKKGKAVR